MNWHDFLVGFGAAMLVVSLLLFIYMTNLLPGIVKSGVLQALAEYEVTIVE